MEAICLSNVDKNDQTLSILRNSPNPPALTYISAQDIQSDPDFLSENIKEFYGDDDSKWPKVLKEIVENKDQDLSSMALSISLVYLKKLLLAETSIPVAEFFHQNDLE